MKYRNLESLVEVAGRLKSLQRSMAFVGGAITEFLITDEAAPEVRPTLDVDVVAEVKDRKDYYRFEEGLRDLGFRHATDETVAVLCRWKLGEIIVDIMPTDPDILGFSNRWYCEALEHAEMLPAQKELSLPVVTAVYFLATKMEAFAGRGRQDYLGSRDMEDIVAVIDGRPELIREIEAAPKVLRDYISQVLAGYLGERRFLDALPGHLGSRDRVATTLESIQVILKV